MENFIVLKVIPKYLYNQKGIRISKYKIKDIINNGNYYTMVLSNNQKFHFSTTDKYGRFTETFIKLIKIYSIKENDVIKDINSFIPYLINNEIVLLSYQSGTYEKDGIVYPSYKFFKVPFNTTDGIEYILGVFDKDKDYLYYPFTFGEILSNNIETS